MRRMKQTHAKKNDNIERGQVDLTRRTGHKQQRVLFLDPNKRRYKRQEGKRVRSDD